MRLLACIALTLVGCSCASLTGQSPSKIDRQNEVLQRDLAWLNDTIPILRFNPPYVYGFWRLQVERCSGLSREGWPKFYEAPINPIPSHSGPAYAFYDPDSDVIVFALGTMQERAIFVHEFTHWLLKGKIPPGPDNETDSARATRYHPPDLFGATSKCAHVSNPTG